MDDALPGEDDQARREMLDDFDYFAQIRRWAKPLTQHEWHY